MKIKELIFVIISALQALHTASNASKVIFDLSDYNSNVLKVTPNSEALSFLLALVVSLLDWSKQSLYKLCGLLNGHQVQLKHIGKYVSIFFFKY